ncbi:hypothetical protein TNCV_612301 [Trichonephila clavipes]|nr:hypothetical protein TNCV_612301 [Trichonephila clavipes]
MVSMMINTEYVSQTMQYWPIHTGDILRLKAFVYNVCMVNRRRKLVAVSGTHLTGLRAYRPMCSQRLYTVCLETVVPVAEES